MARGFCPIDEAYSYSIYNLSLSNVKLHWVRFIRQYSNNPLNEIIDVDNIINKETLKVKTLLK